MTELERFAQDIGGEFVAGCLIGTVDDKRQYLHRDGQFTPEGFTAYRAWEDRLVKGAKLVEAEVEVDAETETKPSKSHKAKG